MSSPGGTGSPSTLASPWVSQTRPASTAFAAASMTTSRAAFGIVTVSSYPSRGTLITRPPAK